MLGRFKFSTYLTRFVIYVQMSIALPSKRIGLVLERDITNYTEKNQFPFGCLKNPAKIAMVDAVETRPGQRVPVLSSWYATMQRICWWIGFWIAWSFCSGTCRDEDSEENTKTVRQVIFYRRVWNSYGRMPMARTMQGDGVFRANGDGRGVDNMMEMCDRGIPRLNGLGRKEAHETGLGGTQSFEPERLQCSWNREKTWDEVSAAGNLRSWCIRSSDY